MVRAFALLVLLTASTLVPLSPAASAQSSPATLCFDRDLSLNGETTSESGPCSTSRTPDYAQGNEIRVRVYGWLGGEAYLSARCTSGCPTSDPSASKVYYVVYRGGQVRFPADFVDAGPSNDGGNAVLDRAPRYNSTWDFTLHLAAPLQRRAHVWLYDAWEDDSGNHTVRPGATHRIVASGFNPHGEVVYRWERRDPNSGRYMAFASHTVTADRNGVFTTNFQLPKDEAVRMAACGGLLDDCYRLSVSGAGKQTETINVRVGYADIVRSETTSPRAAPGALQRFQRTENVTGSIDLYYPGGNLHTGPKFNTDDASMSPRFGGRALRVAVEKYWTINTTSYLLDEVPLRFEPARLQWVAQWTIPKDLEVDSGARYRMRLLEQRDVHGNRVAEDWLVNFTFEAAQIVPVLVDPFRELQRTETGTVRLAVRYHNGTPFTPDEAPVGNSSPLRGCFVRVPPPPPPPAPPANTEVPTCESRTEVEWVYGRYHEGAWNFTVKYPRTYENLDSHRFILGNGTRDRFGNRILAVAGPTYNVAPARMDVEVSTVMRGEEAEVLERGNRIFVSATITYHDGSPYNHQVRVNPNSSAAQTLTGILVRRGPGVNGAYGPIASEEPFNLTLTDARAGRWSAYLQLTDDDTFTPAGIWTWKFEIVDNVTVPNRNESIFDREVVSSVIRVCPTYQPPGSAATGASVKFRFKLYYSECEVGREVPVGAIESKLTVRAYPYNPQTLTTFGNPVSNVLIPAYARDTTQDWGIEYQVPNHLYGGAYAFVVTGADTFGNKLVPNARSRPFSTYTDVLTRTVLTQPRAEVERGDSATVVFDAREGDTGVDPQRAAPRIQLERFDTSSTDCARAQEEGGCWVREIGDVRVSDGSLSDHVGVFPVGVDTPVGTYRFALQGRDRDFKIITAISSNFSVSATQVTRALLELPPERVVKGQPFSFRVESMPGDQLRDRVVFLNGRALSIQPPLLTHERGAINVTWSVPFEAPTGNYTLRVTGRDVNGNIITILTPPIDALPASLEGRIIGQPPRTVARGDVARLHFGVGYPDGSFYAAQDEPRVVVVSAAGTTFPARIQREGLSFAAYWEPGAESTLGEHYFEVQPQAAAGGTGNLFPTLRSQPFRVVPGVVSRNPIDEVHNEVERLGSTAYTVPMALDDRFVGFELVYYGPSLLNMIDTTNPPVEITRTPLPHTLEAERGRYAARVVTDHQTQTGTYRVVMTGEDAHGNVITSQSRAFVIRPTTIGVVFDPLPSSDKFGEGKTIEISFVAQYRVGSLMDSSYGTPSVAALWNGNPITPRPAIEYRDGHWTIRWTAPELLPPGEYQFVVGGADLMNNPVATARTTPYIILEGSLLNSAEKVIPGPSPVLLALVVVAIAGLLFRRRR
ncbi:MAG TPA: hypothetical protein VFH78_12730 [Candidatus Thermoplasmatota archaeon]|nr:hypothetical protein [Candidatus Thermoplasmatota archaeon]